MFFPSREPKHRGLRQNATSDAIRPGAPEKRVHRRRERRSLRAQIDGLQRKRTGRSEVLFHEASFDRLPGLASGPTPGPTPRLAPFDGFLSNETARSRKKEQSSNQSREQSKSPGGSLERDPQTCISADHSNFSQFGETFLGTKL